MRAKPALHICWTLPLVLLACAEHASKSRSAHMILTDRTSRNLSRAIIWSLLCIPHRPQQTRPLAISREQSFGPCYAYHTDPDRPDLSQSLASNLLVPAMHTIQILLTVLDTDGALTRPHKDLTLTSREQFLGCSAYNMDPTLTSCANNFLLSAEQSLNLLIKPDPDLLHEHFMFCDRAIT